MDDEHAGSADVGPGNGTGTGSDDDPNGRRNLDGDREPNGDRGGAGRERAGLRLRGRSFMALVLTPDAPLADWLATVDAEMERARVLFTARPVVLDLGLLEADTPGVGELAEALAGRGIRVIAAENAGPHHALATVPASLSGGRDTGAEVVPDAAPEPEPVAPAASPSLVIDEPVRSGRQVVFPDGDVTVIGAVASGAEVLAGGSVHVYGALRGRAVAGFGGRPDARILCHRLEAELLAIDGYYLTAEDMDAALRGRPVQALLEGEQIRLRPLP